MIAPPKPQRMTMPHGPAEATPLTAHAAFPGRVGISPEEFAEATGTGRTLVYLALQRNEIPHKRIGRRIVIPLSALDRWFREGDPGMA